MKTERIVLICLLAAFVFAALVLLPGPVAAINDPPAGGGNWAGDWTVTDTRSYSDCQINLGGSLYIDITGNLTFNNVTLNIVTIGEGTRGITVNPGGAFYVTGGTFMTQNANYEYWFVVSSGGTLWLEGTNITRVGWNDGPFTQQAGVLLQSDSVRINNTRFQACQGVIISGASINITNSSVGSQTGISFTGGGTAGDSVTGIAVLNGNAVLRNVTIDSLTGGSGGLGAVMTGHGGAGGAVTGLYCFNSTVSLVNCTISSLTGGNGGYYQGLAYGGAGGNVIGIVSSSSTLTAIGTIITNLQGGATGSSNLGGGYGGVGRGFSCIDSSVNITCGTLYDIRGGPNWFDVIKGNPTHGIFLLNCSGLIQDSTIYQILGGARVFTGAAPGPAFGVGLYYCRDTLVMDCILHDILGGGAGAYWFRDIGIGMDVIGTGSSPNGTVLDNNNLTTMRYGIRIADACPPVTNNTMTSISGYFVILTNSSARVESNTLSGTGAGKGLLVEKNGTPTVAWNSFGNTSIAVEVSGANGTFENNSFSFTGTSVFELSSRAMPLIRNNNLSSASNYAFRFTNAGAFVLENAFPVKSNWLMLCSGNCNVIWNISQQLQFNDTGFVFKGTLTVFNGCSLTLRNCTLWAGSPAAGGALIDIRGGAKLVVGNGTRLGNIFGDENYLLRMRAGSIIDARDCTIGGCGISGPAENTGPCVETDDIVLSNVTFNSSLSGLVLNATGSATKLEKLTFRDNTNGVLCLKGSSGNIIGCEFLNNSCGILIEAQGTASVSYCNLTGNGQGVKFCTGGKGDVATCNITNNLYGVVCAENAQGNVSFCRIQSNKVGIFFEGKGVVSHNNTIRYSSDSGIIVACSTEGPVIRDSSLSWNNIGVNCSGSRAGTYNNIIFTGNNISFSARDAVVTLVNCTVFWSYRTDVQLELGADVRLVNSTFDRRMVDFLDRDSVLRVSWHIHIFVTWQSGAPVNTPSIGVQDVNGLSVWDGEGDPSGAAFWLTVPEYEQTTLIWRNLAPLTVTAAKQGLAGSLSVTLSSTKNVEVKIIDGIPPLVSISAPVMNHLQNSSFLTVNGIASDNVELSNLEISINGNDWTAFDVAQDWDCTLTLSDGTYTIHVRATDHVGNTRIAMVTKVTVDTTSPLVAINSPSNTTATSQGHVTVTGTTEPNINVEINGVQATSSLQGVFSVSMDLAGDGEYTITATAQDAAGNRGHSSVTIRLDTTPPEVIILTPANNSRTSNPLSRISGTTEAGATVQINGRAASVNGTEWVLGVLVLAEGENVISVRATDALGNFREVTVRVVLDTRITLLVSFPGDSYLTSARTIRVTGTTDPGAIVKIGALTANAGNAGRFEIDVSLVEGANALSISATDDVGNTAVWNLTVIVDTTAPGIEISYPKEGSKFENATVTVAGKTEPGANVFVGSILLRADGDGKFSVVVLLATGPNTIIVRSVDALGNLNEARINATYTPQNTGGTTKPVTLTKTDSSGPMWALLGIILGVVVGVAIAAALGRKKEPSRRYEDEPEAMPRPPVPAPVKPSPRPEPEDTPEDEPVDEPEDEPDDEPEDKPDGTVEEKSGNRPADKSGD